MGLPSKDKTKETRKEMNTRQTEYSRERRNTNHVMLNNEKTNRALVVEHRDNISNLLRHTKNNHPVKVKAELRIRTCRCLPQAACVTDDN